MHRLPDPSEQPIQRQVLKQKEAYDLDTLKFLKNVTIDDNQENKKTNEFR